MQGSPAAGDRVRFAMHELAGIALLVTGFVSLFGMRWLVDALPPPFELSAIEPVMACTNEGRANSEALQLYAVQRHWVAMMLALAVVSAFMVVLSLAAVVSVGRDCARAGRLGRCMGFWGLLALGLATVTYHFLWDPTLGVGFLSQLLTTLPAASCTPVHHGVASAWLIGECTGFLMVMAMASTVVVASRPTAARLAARVRWLQRLLYGGSLLFVVGMLTVHSTFSWILTNWIEIARDQALARASGDLITSFTMQSGIAYSAIMAIIFLPASAYLGWQARTLMPEEHHESRRATFEWLEQHGLQMSWRDNTKQILALLAPALSAPLLNAFTSIG